MIILTVSMPNGRPQTARVFSVKAGAETLRAFAQRLGVSVLALEWSARMAGGEV